MGWKTGKNITRQEAERIVIDCIPKMSNERIGRILSEITDESDFGYCGINFNIDSNYSFNEDDEEYSYTDVY